MNKFLLLTILLSVFSWINPITAQSQGTDRAGTARGKIVDGNTGEVLLGATVRFIQSGTVKGGAYSDIEGAYSVSLPEGRYQVVVSYISYVNDTVSVDVPSGAVAFSDHLLNEEDAMIEGVEIVAKRSQASEVTLFNIKRTSFNTIDGVTLDQSRRLGDANAAAAIQRVVGVTIEGGKYVYVRGLGDRYSKTMLNGAELPGLDPNKNTVQLDIFPSNLIDNILVYKNFTPNLPGSFSGGLVDVRTKDFPDRLTVRASASVGVNSQATFTDDFIADTRYEGDRLGLGNSIRDIPDYINNRLNGTLPRLEAFTTINEISSKGPLLDTASRTFQTGFLPVNRNSGYENSYQLSVGNQLSLFGRPLGFIIGGTYSQSFDYYDQVENNLWRLRSQGSTNLDAANRFKGARGQENILWGGLAKISYKPFSRHKFSLNLMRNQNGTSFGETFSGELNNESGYRGSFATNRSGYIERSITIIQGQGEHAFSESFSADWIVSSADARQYEPDMRFFAYEFDAQPNAMGGSDTTFAIINNNGYERPLRFYRDLDEQNFDSRLNFRLKIPGIATDNKGAIRFGGAYTTKERSFRETRFEIFDTGSDDRKFAGEVGDYLADDNFISVKLDENGKLIRDELFQGLYYQDQTQPTNVFDATQTITAAYAMVEMPLGPRFNFVGGLRAETTEMQITPKDSMLLQFLDDGDSTTATGQINLTDLLPAASVIYRVNENTNFRAGYSRTLARPTIVELSPFQRLPYIGGPVYEGNPNLERTLISNFDFRWEWFPALDELLSVSAFYKAFQNPIEIAQDSNANTNNIRFKYVNRESAFIGGIEIEFQKNFGFVSPQLSKLKLSTNASFNYSEARLTGAEIRAISSVDSTRGESRPLFGQSPYVFNAELAYVDRDDLGLQVSLGANVFGPRLSFVGVAGSPDIYEQPRPSLNFSVSKTIGQYLSLRVRANNLLNPEYKFTQDLRGSEFVFTNTRMGRTYSMSLTFRID